MKQIGRKYHKNLAALIIILILSGTIILGHLSGVLDYIEYKLYDLRVNALADAYPRCDDIVLVLLDQNSLDWAQRERGWGWPWPRKAYAEFVDYMNTGGANSVAFDVLFSEPSIYRNARQDEIIEGLVKSLETPATEESRARLFGDIMSGLRDLGAREDDASFAGAARRYGRVVQTVFFSTQAGNADSWHGDLRVPLFKLENFDSAISRFALSNDEGRAQFPIKELRDTAGAIGNVTGRPDSDDVVRRVRLFTVFDGKAVPGLSAASLLVSGHDAALSFDSEKNTIRWGQYSVPVDSEGKTLLRFRGDINRYAWYSVSDVLKSAEDYAAGREPLIEPENFKGSYVFFGFYAAGLYDIFNTPVSSVYPGMGVHITMLDNIIMGDFIRRTPDWISALIIAAMVILVVALVLYSGRVAASIIGLVASFAVIIAAGFWAFYLGQWIPMAAPMIASLLAFLSATLYSYTTEGKDKRFIKNAFSRILSPKVIDQIIADPSQLKLGGEKRKMTAIFTDIQRFSSISSELQDEYGEDGPKVLVNLLNLYLTEMSNIVLANGGTIDKYEGDAIIAFFGAPAWMKDHAALACRSAIQMKKRERELVAEVMKPEGQFCTPLSKLMESKAIRRERPLYTRLGINTGDMVVGFMGTPSKMDYTIMGNAVNLAARLEGVNKQYDTHGILISEYTRKEIGDDFIVRPLSRVTVVGIPVPVRLYELLDLRSGAPAGMTEMVKAWESAFGFYESRKIPEAKKIFADVIKNDPADSVAQLYLGRCDKFLASPPPADWDGVDNLTEK